MGSRRAGCSAPSKKAGAPARQVAFRFDRAGVSRRRRGVHRYPRRRPTAPLSDPAPLAGPRRVTESNTFGDAQDRTRARQFVSNTRAAEVPSAPSPVGPRRADWHFNPQQGCHTLTLSPPSATERGRVGGRSWSPKVQTASAHLRSTLMVGVHHAPDAIDVLRANSSAIESGTVRRGRTGPDARG